MAMRSGDGGPTWSAPVKIADVPSRFADDGDSSATRLLTLPIPIRITDDGPDFRWFPFRSHSVLSWASAAACASRARISRSE